MDFIFNSLHIEEAIEPNPTQLVKIHMLPIKKKKKNEQHKISFRNHCRCDLTRLNELVKFFRKIRIIYIKIFRRSGKMESE